MLNARLKEYRNIKGLSQEKVAELVGVSRQAVTKWENGKSTPSSDNLIALAYIYDVSIDELVNIKSSNTKKKAENNTENNPEENPEEDTNINNKLLQLNLTTLAIILQASTLNVALQTSHNDLETGEPNIILILYKILSLAVCSVFMCYNLKYEKNPIQYKKNLKIEMLYCLLQATIALITFYFNLGLIGTVLIITISLVYIIIINPKYMNRQLVKIRK